MSDSEDAFLRAVDSFVTSIADSARVNLAVEALDSLSLAIGAWGVEDPTAAEFWHQEFIGCVKRVRTVDAMEAQVRAELHGVPEARWADDGGNLHV